ncbi:apolipoprotein N-acyltransferase [Fulvivirgaceae bacterium PWU4]|uniref:Apolipoprotein N-acyltransferase n=1 Tax=Chryseosolibacter histidini TaxID=2782349 RepID=A0AAP2GNJ0_9BACT|nr:apolipoprotein N-acyltransferase [Chryseosolibacter histidini]MBT1696577.1 apolipoprotein N-acyltransferase [Chryseosolibacter histidini]
MSSKKPHFSLLVLSMSAALFLSLAWPPLPFVFLLFFAMVPLLLIELVTERFRLPAWTCFLYIYLALVTWHVSTTYWIYKTTVTGGVLIHLINPLLLTIPWLFFRWVKRRVGPVTGYVGLVSAWLALEYFHHSWQFAFPFMTLGNGLSRYPQLVQFYEYTGVLGGSLWILIVNISVFIVIKKAFVGQEVLFSRIPARSWLVPLACMVIPASGSLLLFYSYEEKGVPVEVVAIHPNTDCYDVKYASDPGDLVKRYLALTFREITPNTDYVIWPETAITDAGWLENLRQDRLIKRIKDTLAVYPKSKLITGAILYERYNERPAPEALPHVQYSSASKVWYYTYNAALQLGGGNTIPVRTKKQLVPVEETIPYVREFSVLRNVVSSLGGFSFSTRKVNNNVFTSANGNIGVTPMICYETLFGTSAAEYVNKGSDLLFILLNEGWYKDRTGAAQFMHYACLRAIENRRSIARSSNDGVSCFINQRGELLQTVSEYKPTAIKQTLRANSRKTLYTYFGDYIGVVAIFSTAIILVIALWYRVRGKKPETLLGKQ